MSAEQFRDDLDSALSRAVVNEVDLDAIEAALDDAKERVEMVRVMRGQEAP